MLKNLTALSKTVAGVALVVTSGLATSATIDGKIGLTGVGPGNGVSVLKFSDPACSDVRCWTGFDFASASPNATVGTATGIFQALLGNPFPLGLGIATTTDTTFAGPTGELFRAVSGLKTVSFDWSSVTTSYDGSSWGATFTGTMKATGYEDTPYQVIFSSQGTGVTWSAETVPAPGVLALIGIGLVGMGAARRKAS